MSVFDKPKATDKARDQLNADLASGDPTIWNRMHGALKNVALKCKSAVCKKSDGEQVADCPYTENVK